MTKIEFLSASLPYGLVIYDGYSYMQLYTVDVSNKYLFVKEGGCGYSRTFNESKPVIRHLDTLTKECDQADYNDGKPFIPIVELAKTAGCDTSNYKGFHSNRLGHKVYLNDELEFYYLLSDDSFRYFDSEYHVFLCVNNQFEIFQHLLRWHFWPNKPEDQEVVYVTEEFNPYK